MQDMILSMEYNGEVFDNIKIQYFGDVNMGTGLGPNLSCKLARASFSAWKQLSRINRADYLTSMVKWCWNHEADIVDSIMKDTGKIYNEARAEFLESIHMLEYAAGCAKHPIGELIASEIVDKDIIVSRQPKGVIGIISPWNFPWNIFFWSAAPALVEGNTIVFKGSELSLNCTSMIEKMCNEILPNGVVNVVHGDSDIGKLIVEHKDVNHICFTGSSKVGREINIKCAELHKTCSLEMGGKNAVIVCEDANLELAVDACIASCFKTSGQRCVSASRLIVHSSILDNFNKLFIAKAQQLRVGYPEYDRTPDLSMGPIINEKSANRIRKTNLDVISISKQDYTIKVLYDGNQYLSMYDRLVYPFIYFAKWHIKGTNYDFMTQEVFGPHVCISKFTTLEEALNIFNDVKYGLAGSIITESQYNIRYFRENAECGIKNINLPTIGSESHCPFGGLKHSGNGNSTASDTWRYVTNQYSMTINYDKSGYTMAQGLYK